MKLEENNLFSFAGIIETDEAYLGALALYDYFWVLKPELRVKLVKSWISILEKCTDEKFLEDLAPTYAEGTGIILTSEEPVEYRKLPDNVVPFGRRNVKRFETKKDGSK